MFGHGWPVDPCCGACVFGVVDGDGVVVDGVVAVPVVD
jgi:hypothetical protein